MIRTSVVSLVAIILACTPAAAQLSQSYEEFFNGPAGFLLTKKEAKTWAKISDDAAAKAFIELFWAKRDPDLETSVNEFKLDFDTRVKAADEALAHGNTRGALTDRGKVLILFGAPVRRVVKEPWSLSSLSGTGGDAKNEFYVEVWDYRAEQLPVESENSLMQVFFAESGEGRADFQLAAARRWNTFSSKAIKKAPEALLKNPRLTEAPKFGLLPNSKVATAEQMQWFEGEPTWPEGARAVVTEGLIWGPRHYLWGHLFLPEGTTTELLVGRLGRVDGEREEIGSFALKAKPEAVEGGAAYEFGFQVVPGKWEVDLAAAGSNGPVAVVRLQSEIPEVGLDDVAISPIYWGTKAQQVGDAKLGDSFNVGGWHVLPQVKDVLSSGDKLSYFAYLLNPTLEEGSELPKLTLSISVYQYDERLLQQPPQTVPVNEVRKGFWMFGSTFGLEPFRKSGEYVVRIELALPADGVERVVEIPVSITVDREG